MALMIYQQQPAAEDRPLPFQGVLRMNRLQLLGVLGVLTACLIGVWPVEGANSESDTKKEAKPKAESVALNEGTHVGWRSP